MSRDQDDPIDSDAPALLVLCGATRKKWRPLKGDVIMLGRSPGCDIGLVSPQVAPVHSLIVRTMNGWRIRDCSGRATRVNGKAIQDEALRNGDVLQIGTFSFEVKLPPTPPQVVAAPPVVPVRRASKFRFSETDHERLVRSRRHLAELALSMRRRLRDHDNERQIIERERNELEELERRLRVSHQEHLNRQDKGTEQDPETSEQARQVSARQADLDSYALHLRRQAARLRVEQENFARQGEAERAEFEADLVRQRVEMNQQQESLTQWQQSLARRNTELGAMAGQLTEVLQHERDQLEAERTQLARDRIQMTHDMEQLNRDRESLDRQRLELTQARAELDRLRVGRSAEPASSRETTFENGGPDRLASARKLLQELQQRRKSTLKYPEQAVAASSASDGASGSP